MTLLDGAITVDELHTLALARLQLLEAAERLAVAAPSAGRLVEQTEWRTDAAARFHAAVQTWRDDVLALSALVAAAADEAARVRERLTAQLWGRGL